MAQHTRPEILRPIDVTLTADRPTCDRCSWAWQAGAFTLKRPSAACEVDGHRSLLDGPARAAVTLAGWLQAS